MEFQTKAAEFKNSVDSNNLKQAEQQLNALKKMMVMIDSLPPVNAQTPTAAEERKIARVVFETAAVYAIKLGDKEEFHRYSICLRPYYGKQTAASSDRLRIVGLSLLYLLVENRLSDFHCELELLTEEELNHQYINFCTQIEQHIMVGLYDQVLGAAKNPPVAEYTFFLSSLMETVRKNIADCAEVAYESITVQEATDILMFTSPQETQKFIQANYPTWDVVNGTIKFHGSHSNKTKIAESIPSEKIISQVLSYATELERIV